MEVCFFGFVVAEFFLDVGSALDVMTCSFVSIGLFFSVFTEKKRSYVYITAMNSTIAADNPMINCFVFWIKADSLPFVFFFPFLVYVILNNAFVSF